MKNQILLFLLFVIINTTLKAQEVVSSTFLTSYNLEYFTQELEISFSKYGVDLYRVNYTTSSIEGTLDTASGLVCIPHIEGFGLPLVSYGHGTVDSRYDVPSYLSFEHSLPAIYSSIGTVCVAPDYLGLGDNDGIHPYVHAETEASASYDLIVAVEEFLSVEMNIGLNNQLFITGYSQGGHSAMALHRYVETETDLEVTGSLPMSGPYSISTGMKDLLVSDESYDYVAYLAWTAISYQEVYGTIYPNNDITQFFKQPYADIILKFQNEEASLSEINEELIDSLIAIEGGSFPKLMIQDDLLNAILTEEDHPVNIALRDNDVYDWAPTADTRLLYCMGDDQVAFENSIIARDKMNENGATQVVATDLNPAYDHGECVTPAATSFVFFLLVFADLTSTSELATTDFVVYPNPSSHQFQIKSDNLPSIFSVEVYDISGAMVYQNFNANTRAIFETNLRSGTYILQLKDDSGKPLGFQKLLIQ
ncbi:MAG: T9SS type A sorting domain-containing protein [Saprospiraceae bacterium]|nr:T9SS type A sorting domain-containing protein [Saprospiraceae bacterium]